MTIANAWVKHSLEYHPVGVTTAVILAGLQRIVMPTGTDILKDISDVDVYPDHLSVNQRRGGMEFASVNVAQYLATLGFGPTCITADGTHPGLSSYFAKRACDGIASGSVHNKFTYTTGVILPVSLAVSQRVPAVISYLFRQQGGAQPAKGTSQALPTLPDATERFDLYSSAVGGTALSQNTSINLAFNGQLFEEGADGDIDASLVAFREAMPMVTFRNFAIASFGSVDLDGIACTHANSEFILRKRNVALTTAEHIKITFQGLAHMETIHDANDRSLSEESLVVDLNKTASAGPVVIDTAYAIA